MSCHVMQYKRGSSNIGNKFLKSWEYVLSKCIECCKKEKLCPSNFDDAERFYKTTDSTQSEKGIQLKQEAISQAEYRRHTARLAGGLKDERIKVAAEGSALISVICSLLLLTCIEATQNSTTPLLLQCLKVLL